MTSDLFLKLIVPLPVKMGENPVGAKVGVGVEGPEGEGFELEGANVGVESVGTTLEGANVGVESVGSESEGADVFVWAKTPVATIRLIKIKMICFILTFILFYKIGVTFKCFLEMDQIKSVYNDVYDPLGYTPLFQIIVAFIIGVALSPFARGILFLVIFILIFELWFAGTTGYSGINSFLRPGLILWAFFGFLLGRTLICADWNPIRCDYGEQDNVKNYFEEKQEEQKGCGKEEPWK